MKVIHLLAPAQFGGLERVVRSLAVAQRSRGYDVRVAALVDAGRPSPPLVQQLRDEGVVVDTLEAAPRAYAAQVRSIRRLCRDRSPDILHTHGYFADVLGFLGVRGTTAHIVSTVHGFTGGGRKNRLFEWIDRRVLHRFDAVIPVSRKLADDLANWGVRPKLMRSVVNAWTADTPFLSKDAAREALDIPNDVFSIGWIGRITSEKGLDVLIEAVPALADLPVRVTVVGDGRERAALTERSATLGVADRIAWKGALMDAARMMAAFDVLVISSRTEGTPMTLLEAMDARTPVVATAVGGIPDVISKSDGMLVPSENPAAIATAVRSVYAAPEAAATRAKSAAARLARDFAVEPWLDQYEQVYVSLLPQLRTAS